MKIFLLTPKQIALITISVEQMGEGWKTIEEASAPDGPFPDEATHTRVTNRMPDIKDLLDAFEYYSSKADFDENGLTPYKSNTLLPNSSTNKVIS